MIVDGVNTTPRRTRSASRVVFDLDQNTAHSPENPRNAGRRRGGPDNDGQLDRSLDGAVDDGARDPSQPQRRRKKKKSREQRSAAEQNQRESSGLMHDQYDRPPSHHHRGDGHESDSTEDLPERFDENGNRKASDDGLNSRFTGLFGGGGGGLGDILRNMSQSSRKPEGENGGDDSGGSSNGRPGRISGRRLKRRTRDGGEQ